jgi:ketosteroid isomerase-like protein
MKRSLLIVLLLALATSLGAQQTRHQTNRKPDPKSDVEQELRQLVQMWDQALVKRDIVTLDRLLADDFTHGATPKAQYLDSYKPTNPELILQSASSDDIKVRVYGNTAVLTARGRYQGKYKGEDFDEQWRYLDVWVKQQDQWRCVATESSQINKQ